MKRVIFICLLSLSACLSAQSVSQDPKSIVQDEGSKTAANSKPPTAEVQNASKPTSEAASGVPVQNANVSLAPTSPPVQNSPSNEKIPAQSNSNTTSTIASDLTQNTIKAAEINKTDNKLPETKENEAKLSDDKHVTTNASKNETSTETTGKTDKNSTIIEDKKKKDTNATTYEILTPTQAPTLQSRSFDGASFIGGIILTLGLIAISFMGYKYYKNHTERNYYGTL